MRTPPPHPGEILLEEYLKTATPPIARVGAARRLGMSENRMSEILLGKRSVTAETAVLFAALTRTSPQLWLRLQADYDLWHALRKTNTSKIEPIVAA